MQYADRLSLAATWLDDAVEWLTFDRFDWALEDLTRSLAAILSAASGSDLRAAGIGPRGRRAPAGALRGLLGPGSDERAVLLVDGVEAMLTRADAGVSCSEPEARSEIARLAFEANELLAATGARLKTAVPGAPDPLPADPARQQGIRRRDALRLLAAGGALSLAACTRQARDVASPAGAAPTGAAPASGSAAAPPQPAGIRAVTPLDQMHFPTSDPFLFCANHRDDYPAGNGEFGPAASLQGRLLGRDFDEASAWRMYHGEVVPGFPRHPHRGFETVTVVRTGLLDHADSMGAAARYGGGDVQWLTAGGGIQHAEMFPLLRADADNPLELFQIWLNLPASDKMVAPYFTMLWNERIPRVVVPDEAGRIAEVTVAAGGLLGQSPPPPPPNSWAARPEAEVAIWSVRMEPGAAFAFPAVSAGVERSLYLHRGAGARVGAREVANLHRVEFDGAGPIEVVAGAEEVEILLLQGRPIGEPVARRGPFVMNTQAEIQQAYRDYQATGFGGWPWPGDDPVHGAEPRRFARHIDGRTETPT